MKGITTIAALFGTLTAGLAAAQGALPPAPCSAGTPDQQAACWRDQAKRVPVIKKQLDTVRACAGYHPASAGTADSPCMENTVDSTCRYASGVESPLCSKPSLCAFGSFNYITGRCDPNGLCPPGTARAGQAPDPGIGCNAGCVGGNCPSASGGSSLPQAPYFLLKPGETVTGEFYMYVAPLAGGTTAASAKVEVAGEPLVDMATLAKLLSDLDATGPDIEPITESIREDIEQIPGGGIVMLKFQTLGWAEPNPNCSPAPAPEPPTLSSIDPDWRGATGFAPGSDRCGGYGGIIGRAYLENGPKPFQWLNLAWTARASAWALDDCPTQRPENPWPEAIGTTNAPKGTQPTVVRTGSKYLGDKDLCLEVTHPEISCATGTESCVTVQVHSPEDGYIRTGLWQSIYVINAPSVKVTRVNVAANGQTVLAWPD